MMVSVNEKNSWLRATSLSGDASRILLGDFMYSRAFSLMAEIKQTRIIEILSHATNRYSESKMLQLDQRHRPNMTERECLERIESKATILFAAVTRLAAVIAGSSTQTETALANYGFAF